MNNKSININNQEFTYFVKRSKRAKYVQLRINLDGEIELVIPKLVNYLTAEKFLFEKKDWLYKYFRFVNNKQNRYYYLGNILSVIPENNLFSNNLKPTLFNNKLFLPLGNNRLSIKEHYNNWLKEEANKYIPKRVEFFSGKYGFSYNRITIKNQRTRWGSCSSKRNLSFNYRIMYFNSKVIDYIIIHELCHLKEMNHSKKFWNLVEEIMPDYKIYKQQLKSFFN